MATDANISDKKIKSRKHPNLQDLYWKHEPGVSSAKNTGSAPPYADGLPPAGRVAGRSKRLFPHNREGNRHRGEAPGGHSKPIVTNAGHRRASGLRRSADLPSGGPARPDDFCSEEPSFPSAP